MRYKLIYDEKTRTFTRVDPKQKAQRDFVSHEVMPDIQPYFSIASNRWVDGRTQRREDLKITGCREVDPSEKSSFMSGPVEPEPFDFSDKDLHDLNKIARDRGLY